MMRATGLVMIIVGLTGLGMTLVDWRSLGRSQTERELDPASDDEAMATGPTGGQPQTDREAAASEVPTLPPEANAAETELAAVERPTNSATAQTPAHEIAAPHAVTERSPANVKVFERESQTEPAAPTLWADISTGSAFVSEDSGHANFIVTLSEPADRSVIIIFSTINLSANDQEDFQSQSGTVTFEPGVVSAEIRTRLIDDDVKEQDEEFAIVLNGAPNTVNFRNRRAAVVIKDDD